MQVFVLFCLMIFVHKLHSRSCWNLLLKIYACCFVLYRKVLMNLRLCLFVMISLIYLYSWNKFLLTWCYLKVDLIGLKNDRFKEMMSCIYFHIRHWISQEVILPSDFVHIIFYIKKINKLVLCWMPWH